MGVVNAITIQNVAKDYNLYSSPGDRVKETFHPFRKKYHRCFHALTDVSYTIEKGETVGIIGQNGSGKSTLLQIICGVLTPTTGGVTVHGRISALLELGAGFNPEFTGRENVFLNGSILGISHGEMEKCFKDIVDFAEIEEFIDQPVKTYSSGMYVRLAFAVAINVKPDILIVDEALSVGDIQFQAKCFAKFKEFQEKGVTILFVTHSLDLITRYCSSAILLDHGRIISKGRSKDVVDEYNRLIVKCSTSQHKGKGGNLEGSGGGAESDEITDEPLKENRYGTGKASIKEAGLFDLEGNMVKNLHQGKEYVFRCLIEFNEDVHTPIFAYTIKDVKGSDITGTNTLYQDLDTGAAKKGDQISVSFTQKIRLAAGGYLLSFGCAGYEDGKYVVYDRRYDLFELNVLASSPTVGFFDSDVRIDIHQVRN